MCLLLDANGVVLDVAQIPPFLVIDAWPVHPARKDVVQRTCRTLEPDHLSTWSTIAYTIAAAPRRSRSGHASSRRRTGPNSGASPWRTVITNCGLAKITTTAENSSLAEENRLRRAARLPRRGLRVHTGAGSI